MTQPRHRCGIIVASSDREREREEEKIACNQVQNGVYHNIQLIETAKHLSLVIINNWKRWKCAYEKKTIMTKAIKWLRWWDQGNKIIINTNELIIAEEKYECRCGCAQHEPQYEMADNKKLKLNEQFGMKNCTHSDCHCQRDGSREKNALTVYSSASTSDYWLLFGLITLCAMHLEYTGCAYSMESKWRLEVLFFPVACEQPLSIFNFQFVNEINKHLVNDANAYSSNVHIRPNHTVPCTHTCLVVCFLFEFQTVSRANDTQAIFMHLMHAQRRQAANSKRLWFTLDCTFTVHTATVVIKSLFISFILWLG